MARIGLVTESELMSAKITPEGDLTFTRDNGEVINAGSFPAPEVVLAPHPQWPWALITGDDVPPAGNHAPTVTINTAQTVITGRTATLVWSATDSDGDPLTFMVNWGDGIFGPATSPATHTYTADGTFQATVTASDGTLTGSATQSFVAVQGGGVSPSAYQDAMTALAPKLYMPLGDTAPPPVAAIGTVSPTSSAWPTFGTAVGIGDKAKAVDFSTNPALKQHINLGRPTAIDVMSSWSFAALVQPVSDSGGQDLLCRFDQNTTSNRVVMIGRGSKNFFVTRYASPTTTVSTAADYPGGRVYMLAVTADANAINIYVNRQLAITQAIGLTVPASPAPWMFGHRDPNGTANAVAYMGLLAGAAIFDRKLTLSEIVSLADAAGVPA